MTNFLTIVEFCGNLYRCC